MNVLIVEDEKGLAEEIESFLRKEHFTCDVAATGEDASEKLAVNFYDFVLLDLGLPDYDGIDLLKEAKKANADAAFIIITARSTVGDKIKGLDLGADDYLAKPFSLAEMHSRMLAIGRRKFGLKSSITEIGGFTLDIHARTLMHGQEEVLLTRKEFDVLHYLILHKNKVLTRLQLAEHIWGNILEDESESNYIDVHIKNIRKKLGVYEEPDWIETVRGVGYRVKL
ncbi:MAG: response regulator transcription factor [Cyclobacteriaceae bacterium]